MAAAEAAAAASTVKNGRTTWHDRPKKKRMEKLNRESGFLWPCRRR